MSGKNQGCPR